MVRGDIHSQIEEVIFFNEKDDFYNWKKTYWLRCDRAVRLRGVVDTAEF